MPPVPQTEKYLYAAENIAPIWRQWTAIVVHIKYAKATKRVNYNRNADAISMMGFPAEAIQEARGQANRMKWHMLVFLFCYFAAVNSLSPRDN